MLDSFDHIFQWKPKLGPRDFGKVLHDMMVEN
jgi:hypothetical protein